MKFIRKTIPAGTKLYKTLSRACRYQNVRPSGVECMTNPVTGRADYFAALPRKENGLIILWYLPEQQGARP